MHELNYLVRINIETKRDISHRIKYKILYLYIFIYIYIYILY